MEFKLDQADKILYLKPRGGLDNDDFFDFNKYIFQYVSNGGDIKNVLIDGEYIPHWTSYTSMKSHLVAIEEASQDIRKVAMLSNKKNVLFVSQLSDILGCSNVKHFNLTNKLEAINWLKQYTH